MIFHGFYLIPDAFSLHNFSEKLPDAVVLKLTQHLTYPFQRIRLVIHMHPGCILLMVRVVPQGIDSGIVSSTDVRSQGVTDDQHVLHIVSAHLFKTVIEILLLRFLVSGFLGNVDSLKQLVQACCREAFILGLSDTVCNDMKLIAIL